MPDLEPMTDLENVRAEIDALDQKIVELIARRQQWVVAAGNLKTSHETVRAPDRVEKVISTVRGLAKEFNADPDVVEQCYRGMIAGFIDLELAAHDNRATST